MIQLKLIEQIDTKSVLFFKNKIYNSDEGGECGTAEIGRAVNKMKQKLITKFKN